MNNKDTQSLYRSILSVLKEENAPEEIKNQGANTSWSDGETHTLTLSELEKATEHVPAEDIPVKEIEHLGIHNKHPEVMQERIKKVKIDRPILIYNNRILDGNHRLAKAAIEGHPTIPGKRITIDQLPPDMHDTMMALFH